MIMSFIDIELTVKEAEKNKAVDKSKSKIYVDCHSSFMFCTNVLTSSHRMFSHNVLTSSVSQEGWSVGTL